MCETREVAKSACIDGACVGAALFVQLPRRRRRRVALLYAYSITYYSITFEAVVKSSCYGAESEMFQSQSCCNKSCINRAPSGILSPNVTNRPFPDTDYLSSRRYSTFELLELLEFEPWRLGIASLLSSIIHERLRRTPS